MTAPGQTTFPVLNGDNRRQQNLAGSNGGAFTSGVTLFDQYGNPIQSSNPLSTQDATAGASLANIQASNAATANGIGAQSDAPWPGIGNGSLIAIEKAIALNEAGGQYNTTLPNLESGQISPAQLDINGRTFVRQAFAGAQVVNVAPTNVAAAYTTGQCFGGILKFSGVAPYSKAMLQRLTIIANPALATAPQFTILVYDANPSNGSFLDRSTAAASFQDAANFNITAMLALNSQSGLSQAEFSFGDPGALCVPPDGNVYFVLILNNNVTFLTAADVIIRGQFASY